MSNHAVDRDVASGLADPEPTSSAEASGQRFRAHLADWARRHLARPPGYFLLSGLEHLSEPEARRFVQRVSRLLGEPLRHDFSGELVRDVVDRGVRLQGASTVRYSDTRQGGDLHTDGCHRLGRVPDLFTLFCVRQARSGGALILVHLSDLLDILQDQPEVLDAFRLPVHFDTRDEQSPGVPRTVQRPILETIAGSARIHYLREYIESAHARPDVPPLSAKQTEALNVLDALLNCADIQTRLRLKPGEMIVVNNRSVIHGRTAFPPDIGRRRRLLLRVWIAASRDIFGDSITDPTATGPAVEDPSKRRP